MPKNIYHNHHIIPKYRCKEIGIDPDFPENIIRITRAEHAEAHYHRWLKHKDRRDLWAASIIAKGEMDGLDTSGEKNPFYGKKHSAESRKKMSDASSGENNYFYGKSLSENHKKKLSESKKGEKNCWYGKSFSEEHRKNMSVAQKGKKRQPFTEEHKKNISKSKSGEKHYLYGKHHSEETRKKISLANKGRTHTEESKKKMGKSQIGEKNHFYGKKHSAETLENMRGTRGPQKKTTCPHCLQTGGGSMMKRHHFSNCKEISTIS